MEYIKPTNLCETCRKATECSQKGISARAVCEQYDPSPLDLLHLRDKFVEAVMVGACPRCGSKNTYDCDNPLELVIADSTIGYCLDCESYWCLECGYVFRTIEKGTQCPHWRMCAECSDDKGYLSPDKFMERICPTCEHYDNGCRLEDPSECDKEKTYMCPSQYDLSECPKIKEFLREST